MVEEKFGDLQFCLDGIWRGLKMPKDDFGGGGGSSSFFYQVSFK